MQSLQDIRTVLNTMRSAEQPLPEQFQSTFQRIQLDYQLTANEHFQRKTEEFLATVHAGVRTFATIEEFRAHHPSQKPHCLYCLEAVVFEMDETLKKQTVFKTPQPFEICARCHYVTDFNTLV